MTPLVIGLYSSVPQSGKSTTARLLNARFPVTIYKVSGAMKAMNRALLEESGIPEAEIADYINGAKKDIPVPGLTHDDGTPITCRDIQKTLGLEWGRTQFGPRFWTRPLLAAIAQCPTPIALIDDLRFGPDLDLVRGLDGLAVRIVRPMGAGINDGHASEGLLDAEPFDVTLINGGTLEAFENAIANTLLPMVTARMDSNS